jgi:DNA replication protein DnaC
MVQHKAGNPNSSPADSAPESIADILARTPFTQRRQVIAAFSDAQRAEYDAMQAAQIVEREEQQKRFEAAQEKQRRTRMVESLAADMGPRYSPSRVSLDTFQTEGGKDGKAQSLVIIRLREIAAKLDAWVADGRGLVFIGSVGTGKDHLAAALLYHAASAFGLTCKWVNGRATFQASRDAMSSDKTEADLLRPLMSPTILCVSDPVPVGAALTPWNADLLYRVVDERYRHCRPTWLTLNVKNAEEADQRLTAPVWDRLRDQAEIVACFWDSYRRERR